MDNNYSLETLEQGVEIAHRKQDLILEIEACDKQLFNLFGGQKASISHPHKSGSFNGNTGRTLSPEARRKISVALKARWARNRGETNGGTTVVSSTGRRPMSPAARAKLSKLMKARWAARRSGKG